MIIIGFGWQGFGVHVTRGKRPGAEQAKSLDICLGWVYILVINNTYRDQLIRVTQMSWQDRDILVHAKERIRLAANKARAKARKEAAALVSYWKQEYYKVSNTLTGNQLEVEELQQALRVLRKTDACAVNKEVGELRERVNDLCLDLEDAHAQLGRGKETIARLNQVIANFEPNGDQLDLLLQALTKAGITAPESKEEAGWQFKTLCMNLIRHYLRERI